MVMAQVACGATDWHWLTSAVKLPALAPVMEAPRSRVVVPVLVTVMVSVAVLEPGSEMLRAAPLALKDGPGGSPVPPTKMYCPVEVLALSSEILAERAPMAVGLKVMVMVHGALPVPGQDVDGVELTEGSSAETEKSPGLAPPMVSVAAGEPLVRLAS